jgi:hypothetical protein
VLLIVTGFLIKEICGCSKKNIDSAQVKPFLAYFPKNEFIRLESLFYREGAQVSH